MCYFKVRQYPEIFAALSDFRFLRRIILSSLSKRKQITQRRALPSKRRKNREGNILEMSVSGKALSHEIFKRDNLHYDHRDRYWSHVPPRNGESTRCNFFIILFRSMVPENTPGYSRRRSIRGGGTQIIVHLLVTRSHLASRITYAPDTSRK